MTPREAGSMFMRFVAAAILFFLLTSKAHPQSSGRTVMETGTNWIDGSKKFFTAPPYAPTPSVSTQLANKSYVDSAVAAVPSGITNLVEGTNTAAIDARNWTIRTNAAGTSGSGITNAVAGAGIGLSVSGQQLYVTNTGVITESDPVWAAASNLYRLSSTFGLLASSNTITLASVTDAGSAAYSNAAAFLQSSWTNNGVTATVTNPSLTIVDGKVTAASSLAESSGGTSLTWNRNEPFKVYVENVFAVSNTVGYDDYRLSTASQDLIGRGVRTYETNGLQIAYLQTDFGVNALANGLATSNCFGFEYFSEQTNALNAKWDVLIEGHQPAVVGQAVTNSTVIVYTNATSFNASAALTPTLVAIHRSDLVNTNLFNSYTCRITTYLKSTNYNTTPVGIYFTRKNIGYQ